MLSDRPAAPPPGLVVFDCDGVLVDSDRIALRIQAERIAALGLPTSYEDCRRDFLGLGMPATLRILEERLGAAGATVFGSMAELPALLRLPLLDGRFHDRV